MKVDLKNFPSVLNVLNNELNAGNICEVKIEKNSITVVKIDRKVKEKKEIKE